MLVTTAYEKISLNTNPSPEQTYFYMMNCLLYSRLESGFPTNDGYFDEDVNVYIASMLTSLIYPEYQGSVDKYLSPYDGSLFESVSRVDDPRLKYMIYKSNADYLLASLGIFGNPRRRRPSSIPYMHYSNELYIGRGKTYYKLAESLADGLFRGNGAVGEVLGKLSRGFEKYIKVLSFMKGEYFNLIKKFTDGELYHLNNSINTIERRGELRELYDSFLDAYSSYRKRKNKQARRKLEGIISQIKTIDPLFRFDFE